MGIRAARLSVGIVGVLMFAPSGCGLTEETQDTLEPLEPPPGQTTSDVAVATTVPSSVRDTSPPTTTAPPDEPRDIPTGDWEGYEQFDVGRIGGLTTVGDHRAIRFDRYTYVHPRRGNLDAPVLRDEPVVYWYRSPPFVNYSEQLRTFVLDPDLTVLVLDPDSRPERCGRGPRSEPSWQSVGMDFLRTPAAQRRIASLTYSAEGLVTRIRFTRGC